MHEQNIIKEKLQAFRMKEDQRNAPMSPSGFSNTSTPKIFLNGKDFPVNKMVSIFLKNLQTICQVGQQEDDEMKTSIQRSGSKKDSAYTDLKNEKKVEQLGDEFEVLSDGIQHILKISCLEQDRNQQYIKRKELWQKLKDFRDLKDEGIGKLNI